MKTVFKHVQFYGPEEAATALADGYYILDKLIENTPQYSELHRRVLVERLGDKVILTIRLYKLSRINWDWVVQVWFIGIILIVVLHFCHLFF